MIAKEEASLRVLYASWPIDRLARASTLEKNDYQHEAVLLMLEELNGRGVVEKDIPVVVASMPPLLPGRLPERDTWLFPAQLSRRRYVIRTAIFCTVIVVAAFALELVPAAEPISYVILGVCSLVYGAVGLLLPRSKDAGLPSGLAMVFALIPITAVVAFLFLFFTPSKDPRRG